MSNRIGNAAAAGLVVATLAGLAARSGGLATSKAAALAITLGLGSGGLVWHFTPPAAVKNKELEKKEEDAPKLVEEVEAWAKKLGNSTLAIKLEGWVEEDKKNGFGLPRSAYYYYYLSKCDPERVVSLDLACEGQRPMVHTPMPYLHSIGFEKMETFKELKEAIEAEKDEERDSRRDWTVTFVKEGKEETVTLPQRAAENAYKVLKPDSQVAKGGGWYTGKGSLTITVANGKTTYKVDTIVGQGWDREKKDEYQSDTSGSACNIDVTHKGESRIIRASDLTKQL